MAEGRTARNSPSHGDPMFAEFAKRMAERGPELMVYDAKQKEERDALSRLVLCEVMAEAAGKPAAPTARRAKPQHSHLSPI